MTEADFEGVRFLGSDIVYQDGKFSYLGQGAHNYSYLDGKRRTLGQPELFDRRCFLFGNSRIVGSYSRDKNTPASLLQNLLNHGDTQYRYRVENEAVSAMPIPLMLYQLKQTELNPGDIVLFSEVLGFRSPSIIEVSALLLSEAKQYCDQYGSLFAYIEQPLLLDRAVLSPWEKYISEVDHSCKERLASPSSPYLPPRRNRTLLPRLCTKYQIPYYATPAELLSSSDTIFVNPTHCGERGNPIFANYFYEIIQSLEYELLPELDLLPIKLNLERDVMAAKISKAFDGVETYITALKQEYATPDDAIASSGAIVMNCNPFTKGHRRLIEYVSSRVNRLFIFVAQENKFPRCKH